MRHRKIRPTSPISPNFYQSIPKEKEKATKINSFPSFMPNQSTPRNTPAPSIPSIARTSTLCLIFPSNIYAKLYAHTCKSK